MSGARAEIAPVSGTEHPAAALYHLTHQLKGRSTAVMLDISKHLDDARALRLLRDTIDHFNEVGSTLVLVEHGEDLPAVITTEATRFETSLPDEVEILRKLGVL